MSRMDEKKLHTLEFQLKGSGSNMRCKLLQKRFTGKTIGSSKHLRHIAIEKDHNFLSELNRCIFQISLKYIKLVRLRDPHPPPLQQYNPTSNKINISDPSPSKDFSEIFNPPPKSSSDWEKNISKRHLMKHTGS